MASEDQVRQYLAYWFQLGKKVLVHDGREALLPQPVIQGDRYSDAFETCWKRVTAPHSGACHLEGTNQTIQELLSPQWEVNLCARCDMPVPQLSLGTPSLDCPCIDLPGWPNMEMPQPRSPINSTERLNQIRDRLLKAGQRSNSSSY